MTKLIPERWVHAYVPGGLYSQAIEELGEAERRERDLSTAVERVRDQAAGYEWRNYGDFRGKVIVLSEKQLQRLNELIETSRARERARIGDKHA